MQDKESPAAASPPTAIIDTLLAEWEQVDAALSPVIGHRGVAALFKRSLFLTAPAHPWLALPQDGIPARLALAPLRHALLAQAGAEAVAGNAALRATLSDLLATLVGTSLTERLLRSARAQPPRGPSRTDPSP